MHVFPTTLPGPRRAHPPAAIPEQEVCGGRDEGTEEPDQARQVACFHGCILSFYLCHITTNINGCLWRERSEAGQCCIRTPLSASSLHPISS